MRRTLTRCLPLLLAAWVGLLLAGCQVKFEPQIEPIAWPRRDSEGRFVYQDPPPTFDPASLEIPLDASREEMLYYAELLGFGKDGRPTIDEYFNPYLTRDPVTGEYSTEPSPGLMLAAKQLYGGDEGLWKIAQGDFDNPLNFWQEDPLGLLTGDAQADLGATMAIDQGRIASEIFLERIDADPLLSWNYEPAWLATKMAQNPKALRRAQLILLQQVLSSPDVWEQLQQMEPFGATE